ncbi:alkaline phosphatase family protein [Sphingomonas agri]|uniref:alkaline phosphatase family protein n=1 Tax=Sphingomonas agri TaxID=1813878 RepID=UPI00311E275E
MRKLILAVAAALIASQSGAQPQARPPRLLVVISIDQFSADLFDQYRPQFTGGFARLASGTVFHNGYQSHAATETCPGHSTILTGDHPSRTGIVNNVWIDQSISRSDKSVYCAEDETRPGTSSTAYKVSPTHLVVPTLGELMKARWPGSRSVAVAGKDRAAVMMTGHLVDQRWYWDGKTFVTDLESAPVPRIVPKFTAALAAALAQSLPALEAPPLCQGRAAPIVLEGGAKTVGSGQLARAAGDLAAFRASPELDGDTLALAAGLLDEMQLGRGASSDLLAISLSATDYVGHAYGPGGQEMCLQLLELDRELGDFLQVLDRRGIDYAVALTADHGGKDIPERERLAGVRDAARVDPALSPATMGKALTARLALRGPGLLGDSPAGDMWVDHSLPASDQHRLLSAALAAYRAHPQVEAVFSAAQIAATAVPTGDPAGWSVLQRVRASYYPGRSGDLFVVLKPNITPIASPTGSVATHGSVWDYDRRVPILFWRPGTSGSTIERSAETTDILPTLAGMIGLSLAPGSIDGHCLAEVPGASCPAR